MATTAQAQLTSTINAAIKDLQAQARAKKLAITNWWKSASKGVKANTDQYKQLHNQYIYLNQDVDAWLKQATVAVREAAYNVSAVPSGVGQLDQVPTAMTGGGSMLSLQAVMPPVTQAAVVPAPNTTIPVATVTGSSVSGSFQYVNTPIGQLLMPLVVPGGQYPAAPAGYVYTQTAYGLALIPGSTPAPAPTDPIVSASGQSYYSPAIYQQPVQTAQPTVLPSQIYYAPTAYQQPVQTSQYPSYTPSSGASADNFDMPYAPPPADVYPPSSATMVMTSPGGPSQSSPEVMQTIADQQASQYQSDEWGYLWPSPFDGFGGFASQVMVPVSRPVRKVRRRLTAIQSLNSLPILFSGFGAGEISGLLSSGLGAASNIGGAAITSALAPKQKAAAAAAPVVIQQAAPAPTSQLPTIALVIGGISLVGVMMVLMKHSKS